RIAECITLDGDASAFELPVSDGGRKMEGKQRSLNHKENENGDGNAEPDGGEGRKLFAGVAGGAGRVYAGRSDRRSEADRANGGRVCGEGSFPGSERPGKQEAWFNAAAGAQRRGSRIDGRRSAGRVWRRWAGQNRNNGADREALDLWRICGDTRS